MQYNGHDAYLESRILSADPLELVCLLYQAASGAVREARRHLAAGNIAARSRSITKACEIVLELSGSLNHAQGGAISQRLAQLYEYMVHRLVQANLQQSDEPLGEVLSLLATLSEGWSGIKPVPERAPDSDNANSWTCSQTQGSAAYSASRWSL